MRDAVQLGRDRSPCAFGQRIIEEELARRKLMPCHDVRHIHEIHHAYTVLRHQKAVADIKFQKRIVSRQKRVCKHCRRGQICFGSGLEAVLLTQGITTLHLFQSLCRLRGKTHRMQKHCEKYEYISDLFHFHPTKIANNYIKRR